MKIAFFDSGLGGLLMMESVRKKLPQHSYTYLGDTQNVPYGPRSPQEILNFIEPLILSLIKQHDYLVIACNTVCVKALPLWIQKYPQFKNKIINIVELTKTILGKEVDDRYLLATVGTVRSRAYNDCVNPRHQYAMPGLVDLIERLDKDAAIAMVNDVIAYIHKPTQVILGCTHYVWLQDALSEIYPEFHWCSQDVFVVQFLRSLSGEVRDTVVNQYFITGDVETYSQLHNLPFQQYKNH